MISLKSWSTGGLNRTLWITQSSTPLITSRHSSLSAIHRGLRRSDKFQHDSPRGRDQGRRDRSASSTETANEGRSWRQQQQLRKKLARQAAKREEKEDSDRMTRRKRFLDPESTFGKTSLVYHLKHGSLKDKVASLDVEQPVRPRGFYDRQSSSQRTTWERKPTASRDAAGREKRVGRWESQQRDEIPRRDSFRRGDQDTSQSERPFPTRGKKKTMMPMTIKYTTAASQFLYGKSVVKAALEQGNRKLYNLYIYGGENRKESKDNDIMEQLARRHKVPITIVPNDEQRIMDKMSMGRPHNGFVLETSPLPKMPVKALGRVHEMPTPVGFHVELDHQTKEEEAINGTNSFINRPRHATSQPFVLLLNEILDPGNLGALLRTASYLGVDAVGITNRSSSTLTPVTLKSAAGAVEELTIFTVDSPVEFLERSRKAGWKAYAAVAPPERKLVKMHSGKFIDTESLESNSPLRRNPCILVLGNEGFGLSKQIKVAADYELSIPRFKPRSSVDSLNVSVAGALLCHSFVKTAETADMAEADGTMEMSENNSTAEDTRERSDLNEKLAEKRTGEVMF